MRSMNIPCNKDAFGRMSSQRDATVLVKVAMLEKELRLRTYSANCICPTKE